MIITRDTAPIHPDDRLASWYRQRSTYLNSADIGHGGPVEEPLSATSPETSAGPTDLRGGGPMGRELKWRGNQYPTGELCPASPTDAHTRLAPASPNNLAARDHVRPTDVLLEAVKGAVILVLASWPLWWPV